MLLGGVYYGQIPIVKIYKSGTVIWDAKTQMTLSLACIIDYILHSNEDNDFMSLGLTQINRDCFCSINLQDGADGEVIPLSLLTHNTILMLYDIEDNNILDAPTNLLVHMGDRIVQVSTLSTSEALDAVDGVHNEGYNVKIASLSTPALADAMFGVHNRDYKINVAHLSTSVSADAIYIASTVAHEVDVSYLCTSVGADATTGTREGNYNVKVSYLSTSEIPGAILGGCETKHRIDVMDLVTSVSADATDTLCEQYLKLRVYESMDGLTALPNHANYDKNNIVRFITDGSSSEGQTVILHRDSVCNLSLISSNSLGCFSSDIPYHNVIDWVPKNEDSNFACCNIAVGSHIQKQFESSDLSLLHAKIVSMSSDTTYSYDTETDAYMDAYIHPIQTDTNLYIPQIFAATHTDTDLNLCIDININ